MKKKCLCALFLLVVLSAPAAAEIYYPIWGTLKAQAGSASQSNDDLIMNCVDLDSSEVSCNRTTSGDDYIYSVTFTKDFDNDGSDDALTFDLRIEAFEGSTFTYSETAGASSMTALGASTDVTDDDSNFGVGEDDDIDEGESLRFRVENIACSAGSVTFEGLTSVSLVETNGGHSHKYIPGEGTGLDSGTFNTTTETCAIDDAFAEEFVITGAGSYYAGSREWAVSGISFMFRGPLVDWDVTDYSYYKIGAEMLDEYPAQTDFTNYPDFSWDTVPRWIIARKHIAWTQDEIEALATYPLIVWEKSNKAGFDYVEDGIIDASTQVKAINPSVKSIFYRNSKMHYGGYISDATYDEWEYSQHTIDENGDEVLYYVNGRLMYDHDVAAMRDWWVYDSALPTVLNHAIDGIFYDKCGHSEYLYDGNGDPADNYIEMLDTMDQELPSGKLVMGNTLRNERGNGSRDLMRILEGSYLERWNLPLGGYGQTTADAICVSMQLMMEASEKGKFICFKTGDNSGDKTQEEMQADMPYHLALYLIVADQYSYFAYQDTVAAHLSDYLWETSWMPEFTRPLGEPLGQAIKDGYVYTRSFEHMDVWVNVETEEIVLAWDSVDSDSDGMDDLWEYRNFGDTTSADASDDPDGDGATNLEEYNAGTNPNIHNNQVNVARGKNTSQSTTKHSGASSRAVDGNTSGLWSDGSVTHTDPDYPPHWWQVDLGAPYAIEEIQIYGRTDSCCQARLSNYDVYILDCSYEVVWSNEQTDYPDPSVFLDAEGTRGRFVKIQLQETDEALSLAEVRVLSETPAGYCGDLTLDGKVNLEDYAALSAGWLAGYTMADLLHIVNDWLAGTIP